MLHAFRPCARVVAGALALLALTAAPAAAQQEHIAILRAAAPAELACVAAAPSDRWPADTVRVFAFLPYLGTEAYLEDAATIANTIAALGRATYGGSDTLVAGEPMLDWRALKGIVFVVAHRDGRLTWTSDTLANTDEERAGAVLIGQALEALARAHTVPAWPATLVADSVRFRLSLGVRPPPALRPRGEPGAWSDGAIVTLRMPPEQPVQEPAEHPRPRFPHEEGTEHFKANLQIEFVVDGTGRAEPATFRELQASSAARLMTYEQHVAYDAFVDAVRVAVMATRYVPARVAGCPTRMLVQQAFTFSHR